MKTAKFIILGFLFLYIKNLGFLFLYIKNIEAQNIFLGFKTVVSY